MIRKLARHFDPAYVVPELRAERVAVTVPCPSPEQKAAEDAQVRLLEAALKAVSIEVCLFERQESG